MFRELRSSNSGFIGSPGRKLPHMMALEYFLSRITKEALTSVGLAVVLRESTHHILVGIFLTSLRSEILKVDICLLARQRTSTYETLEFSFE
jgi:hypothetical protein